MIFRLTRALSAGVRAGELEALPLHVNPLFDWSAHLFLVGRSRFILVSNTASLLSAVASCRGVTGRARFCELALDAARRCVESHGVGFAPEDGGSVRFAKALSRSVSGSMGELARQAEPWLSEGELTLPEVGRRLNDTLLSALAAGGSHGYGKPREAFRALVAGAGPT